MPAVTSAGQEAVELAATAGLVLDPWQVAFLHDALGEQADGRWAAFEAALIVPRQNGKGAVLEALELAGLFLFEEQLILHSAHEFKTAAEAFRRVLWLIQSTPDLDRLVSRVRTSHGEEGIELRTGQRLRFVARSTGSGRGFTGDRVILDEAYNLPAAAMRALLPTMAARANPQLIYTSSAPLDRRPESDVLRRLCRRGRDQATGAGPASMVYAEYAADEQDDPDDPAVWAASNPGVPHRISVEHIANERDALDPEGFAQERLGIWDDTPADARPGVFPPGTWDAGRRDVGIVGTPVFALAVSEDRAWSTFAAAGPSTAGGDAVAVEVVDARERTGWVVDRAKELHERWGGELVVAKGSPAGSLVPDLLAAGVPVHEVGTVDMARACGQLYDAVAGGRLHHRGQPVLDVAVAGAVTRPVGDAWTWALRRSGVDISPLQAVTLAAGRHGAPPERAPAPASATPPSQAGNEHLYRPVGRLDI